MKKNNKLEAFESLIDDYPMLKLVKVAFDRDNRSWFKFETLIDLMGASRELKYALGYSDDDAERIDAAASALDSAMEMIADDIDAKVFELCGVHTNFIEACALKVYFVLRGAK